jgi:hypothetical protein
MPQNVCCLQQGALVCEPHNPQPLCLQSACKFATAGNVFCCSKVRHTWDSFRHSANRLRCTATGAAAHSRSSSSSDASTCHSSRGSLSLPCSHCYKLADDELATEQHS